jgi:hypothetical protein
VAAQASSWGGLYLAKRGAAFINILIIGGDYVSSHNLNQKKMHEIAGWTAS